MWRHRLCLRVRSFATVLLLTPVKRVRLGDLCLHKKKMRRDFEAMRFITLTIRLSGHKSSIRVSFTNSEFRYLPVDSVGLSFVSTGGTLYGWSFRIEQTGRPHSGIDEGAWLEPG